MITFVTVRYQIMVIRQEFERNIDEETAQYLCVWCGACLSCMPVCLTAHNVTAKMRQENKCGMQTGGKIMLIMA